MKVSVIGLSLKEYLMTDISKTQTHSEIASEINRLHQLAFDNATAAMQHAKDAGEMLMLVKKGLPHGEFTNWIESNLTVSPRQAQRYMAVAQGKKVAIRELNQKNDTVSDLKSKEHKKLMDLYENPPWIPTPNCWHTAHWDNATYHVVPDIRNPEYFYISKLYQADGKLFDIDLDGVEAEIQDEKSRYSGTTSSDHPLTIAVKLYTFGLTCPEKVFWEIEEGAGLDRPFCEPLSVRPKHWKKHD